MKTTRVKNTGRTGTAARTETAKHLTRWERAANEEERALREEHHLTMTEAAKRCKLTRPAISQQEHQARGMTLVKIARAYGMGPDLFLNHARRWFAQVTLWLLMLEQDWDGAWM